MLSPEDRQKYLDLKKEFENKDLGVDISLKIGVGLAGLGFLSGRSATVVSLLFNRNLITVSLRAIGVGLVRMLRSSINDGIALIRGGMNILRATLKGQALAGKVARVARGLRVAGKVLTYLGFAFDLITLIYDAVTGEEQREEFREAIKELCVRRFTVKEIQQYTHITLSFESDAKAIIDLADSLQDLVDDGTIDQAVADAKVAKKMNDLEPKLSSAIDAVDDESVWKILSLQDAESKITWTDEDPNLSEILHIIDEEIDKDEKNLIFHIRPLLTTRYMLPPPSRTSIHEVHISTKKSRHKSSYLEESLRRPPLPIVASPHPNTKSLIFDLHTQRYCIRFRTCPKTQQQITAFGRVRRMFSSPLLSVPSLAHFLIFYSPQVEDDGLSYLLALPVTLTFSGIHCMRGISISIPSGTLAVEDFSGPHFWFTSRNSDLFGVYQWR
ncbi:hypothetical protein CPB84DRAFT_1849457 [Gymnopilus junonius]|uniref:Uncharacterized protein n=1 Tax=Gymnopilus junonius TaxID=109634 RepID=A0A9P5NG94_GYMJU|nr:hypothetical protein CPB84DRAFT_1849457 [Gymnopilus junonius]